jgi:chromodomain-helicase-DNA-binding protein 7
LKKIPYQHIVLDEAHRLKNKNAKTTMILNKLPCCRKTLLTGTPIQNNTKELWTLLNFIEPK